MSGRADHARRLSNAEHLEIRRRVFEGESFASAAVAVGCSTKSIQRFMARTGGLSAPPRARSPWRLSLAEREELSRGLLSGDSLRQIAVRLKRAASTI
jgi:DNA-binding NarL/FixJ family response regulator